MTFRKHVLRSQALYLMAKTAASKKDDAEQKAKKTVNMDSNSGLLADLASGFTPFSGWGSERAGRATSLGLASGKDYSEIPFGIRNPKTDTFLRSLLLGLGGAAAGGIAGGALDKFVGVNSGTGLNLVGTGLGAGLGASAGSALGALWGIISRRNAARDLQSAYIDSPGTNVPVQTDRLSTFLPGSGAWLKGQVDAANYLSGRSNSPRSAELGTNVANLVGGAVSPLALPIDIGTNIYARAKAPDEDNSSKGKKEKKAAAFLFQLKNATAAFDLQNPLHTGLAGAGLGSLVGLVSQLRKPKRDRSYLGGMFGGGLLGGGLGAAGGFGLRRLLAPELNDYLMPPRQIATSYELPKELKGRNAADEYARIVNNTDEGPTLQALATLLSGGRPSESSNSLSNNSKTLASPAKESIMRSDKTIGVPTKESIMRSDKTIGAASRVSPSSILERPVLNRRVSEMANPEESPRVINSPYK